MISQHKTQRINEGSLPYYRRSQRLKYTMCLAVRASANNLLGAGLLACSQRMNRDITSSASSPPSIDINSMWACWLISQSVRSCVLCKYLMIGWSASTNNIVQGGDSNARGCGPDIGTICVLLITVTKNLSEAKMGVREKSQLQNQEPSSIWESLPSIDLNRPII